MSVADAKTRGAPLSIRISKTDEEKRFDPFLAGADLSISLSRAQAKRLIEQSRILLNGRRVKASFPAKAGNMAEGKIPKPEPLSVEPEAFPLSVLYENGHILVVDKPAGLAVADPVLRDAVKKLNRQALHAYRLTFTHPKTGEKFTFSAPLPPDMEEVLTCLRAMGKPN